VTSQGCSIVSTLHSRISAVVRSTFSGVGDVATTSAPLLGEAERDRPSDTAGSADDDRRLASYRYRVMM